MAKKILIIGASFLGALLLLLSALFLTSLIPNSAIYDNMLKSAMSYDGADPFYQPEGRNTVTDNYADVILLNIVWNIDSNNPIVSSIDTRYYDGNDGVTDNGENYGFYAALMGAPANTDYTRYWHGSSVFIRPLMLVTDCEGIKAIGFTAAILLLILDIALLIKRKQYYLAVAVPLSFILCGFLNIRLSLEYQPAFLVCLFVLPFYIMLEKKGDTAIMALSVISGVMIAFFDFLTCETITILIPLIVVLAIRRSERRFADTKTGVITSLKALLCWGLSYISAFLVKWTAASIVTGENKFAAALSSVEERFVGELEGVSQGGRLLLAPFANISVLFGGTDRADFTPGIIGIIVLAAVICVIALSARKNGKYIYKPSFIVLVLIIGFIPYTRYIVLSNHSYLHDFFTYRAQAAFVLALLLSLKASLFAKLER